MDTVTLAIPTLTSPNAAADVRAALEGIEGARLGRADTHERWVTVAFDPERISVAGIARLLGQRGIDVVGLIPAANRRTRGRADVSGTPAAARLSATPVGR